MSGGARAFIPLLPPTPELLGEFPIGLALSMSDTACDITVAGYYRGRVLLAYEDERHPHISFMSLEPHTLRRLATHAEKTTA